MPYTVAATIRTIAIEYRHDTVMCTAVAINSEELVVVRVCGKKQEFVVVKKRKTENKRGIYKSVEGSVAS
jgi:hypothetical protein